MKRITGVSSKASPSLGSPSPGIFAGRVKAIILDDKQYPDIFKKYGGWSSIGTIFFNSIDNPNIDPDPTNFQFAKPLFPNQKYYPLLNEIVYIISLPNTSIQKSVNSKTFYYFQPINLWNNNHHNATPDPYNDDPLPLSQQQDYEQTALGAVRRVTDDGTEINLGKTFKEKINIKTLLPFEGDIIYEGRWGQSLRFGSTVKGSSIINPWSSTGENGDPITILRNSQYDDKKDAWIPQIEDINKEGSSIYFTSTQRIPIEVSSKKLDSFSTSPISPDKYEGEQLIINSGRLLFNSKKDSILFSSAKSISLSSLESVNIDSPKTVIQSKEVYLGDKLASEPIILGNTFLDGLKDLLNQMISLGKALQDPIGTPEPYTPHATIPIAAVQVTEAATTMINSIESYKSKVSKTK